ncbi:hypothetical protein ACGF12_35900 [Kitasatospora sp. NPDC048296]|uniref:hypothetical protein n=1 Tax=Kitasatospora sp. NPDC048296 TaxID=3364048 RepID=UPI00371D258A
MTMPIRPPRPRRPATIRQDDLVRLGLAFAAMSEAIRVLVDPEAPDATAALNRAMARATGVIPE